MTCKHRNSSAPTPSLEGTRGPWHRPHAGLASPPPGPFVPLLWHSSPLLPQQPTQAFRLGSFYPLHPLTQGVPPWHLPHLTHLLVYGLCPHYRVSSYSGGYIRLHPHTWLGEGREEPWKAGTCLWVPRAPPW